jgi:hypothetical protein
MSSYRFGQTSPVSEIIVQTSAGGGVRTFLFAGENISHEQSEAIKTSFSRQGWLCTATLYDGRPCLEVRGPKGIQIAESILRQGNFITGEKKVIATDRTRQKFSPREFVSNNKLLTYGLLNLAADIGILFYGRLKRKLESSKKQWEDELGGVAYTLGSLMFVGFGRGDKSDHHLHDVAHQLQSSLAELGATPLPNRTLTFVVTDTHRSLLSRINNFLQRHTSEIGNAFTGTAGALYVTGSLRSKNVKDGMLGLSTAAAGYTSALAQEKAFDPKEPKPKTWTGRAWRWVEERPNRVAGWGFMISTVIHAGEALNELLHVKKKYRVSQDADPQLSRHPQRTAYWAYGLRLWFAIVNTIGEFLLTFASKGVKEGGKSGSGVSETTLALVANAIAYQPTEMQERLINELSANFLSRPEILGGDVDDIKKALTEQVKILSLNPWTKAYKPSVQAKSMDSEQNNQTTWRTRRENEVLRSGPGAPVFAA